MPLADIGTSRAVLIGTAGYRHLPPLPAVAANLDALAARLRDPRVWGLSAEHCSVVLDPGSSDEVLDVVHDAARAATGTLLIYYAGYALLDDESELLLGLTGSDRERLYRSLRFADLRRELTARTAGQASGQASGPIADRAVILDCVPAGAGDPAGQQSRMTARAAGPDGIADRAAAGGAWLLAGTAADEAGFAAPGEQYSAFTGALLGVLDDGIAGGPDLIDVDALHLRISNRLAARKLPRPQQRIPRPGRPVTFARNRAVHAPAPAAAPAVDDQPYLRLAPAVLAERLAALRAHGHPGTAMAVLASCGRRRPPQEVAAIMVTLASLRRPKDVAAVAFAAAGRDPHELRQVFEVLLAIDQRPVAAGLLKVVAAGLPERTARFAAVLDEPGTAVDDALPVLLRAAVGFAENRPQRLIDLLGSLLLAGREADAALVLTEAQRVLAPADLAAVADALRAADRPEQATVLYRRAAAAVLGRPAAELVPVVAALVRGGSADAARDLVRRAVAARAQAPADLAELIVAFETAGPQGGGSETGGRDGGAFDGFAELDPALGLDPALDLDAVARELRERGHPDPALRLYLGAVTVRGVDEILRLHAGLNEQGRPIDALTLLAQAARVRSIADLDRLTRTPGPAGRRIFATVAGGPADRTAALYRLLGRFDDGRLEQLRAEVLRCGESGAAGVAAELLRQGAPDAADEVLRAALTQIDGVTVRRLAAAAVDAGRWDAVLRLTVVAADEDLPAIFQEVRRGLPDPAVAAATVAPLLAALPRRAVAAAVTGLDAGAALMRALAARPAAELAGVVAAVTRSGSVQTADELLTAAVQGPVTAVAALIAELRGRGERAHLRTLMELFREHHGDGSDLFKLAGWLWALDEQDLARLVLRGRLWLGEPGIADARATAVADLLHTYAVRTGRLDQAFPELDRAEDGEELLRAYAVGSDRFRLLVLGSRRSRRLTPVLFTEGGVQHVNGDRFTYRELRSTRVSAGTRGAVLFTGPGERRSTWPMPTAGAADELTAVLAEILAVTAQFADEVVTGEVVADRPVEGTADGVADGVAGGPAAEPLSRTGR